MDQEIVKLRRGNKELSNQVDNDAFQILKAAHAKLKRQIQSLLSQMASARQDPRPPARNPAGWQERTRRREKRLDLPKPPFGGETVCTYCASHCRVIGNPLCKTLLPSMFPA